MDFQNQVVAITETDSAVSRAVADAFASEGATVEWISSELAPGDFTRAHPRVDTLILLVPQFRTGETLEIDNSAWAQALDGALARSIQLIQAVGKQMVAQQHGCILILGGLAGTTGFPGWAMASAVEGALLGLTRSLACEWATSNVRVLYVACSSLQGADASAETWAARTPLGRNAEPAEIARVALYLASERASFTTGSLVHVDGGWTAWGLLK